MVKNAVQPPIETQPNPNLLSKKPELAPNMDPSKTNFNIEAPLGNQSKGEGEPDFYSHAQSPNR